MSKTDVIAVFDVGKTNKKVILFNERLNVLEQDEQVFPTITDKDGFECDNIELIEKWIFSTISELANSKQYNLLAVNYSTYGASLILLDKVGKRLGPLYNYLKEIDGSIQESLFKRYGGRDELCRQTRSPALGRMLNSGIQLLWLKETQADIFNNAESVLHFPQYLSYLLTGEVLSEPTSIGCHTLMWDFERHSYHKWLKEVGIKIPEPICSSNTRTVSYNGHCFESGIGIHDSSASLVPYLEASKEPFILVSTGTWCINMNPFDETPLSTLDIMQDCLSLLSIEKKAVKSSRLFMGYIHDINTKRLLKHFGKDAESYKDVFADEVLLRTFLAETGNKKLFFKGGVASDYIDVNIDLSRFNSFKEAYHRLIYDLTLLNIESIELINGKENIVQDIFVAGGFAKSEIFLKVLATLLPDKNIYTSELDNSSALGAAMVLLRSIAGKNQAIIDLKLKEWKAVV